jgi:hypothetical protein
MSDPASPPPAPPVEKASVVEDLVDIFYAPSTVFERRRDSSPWIPLIVVTVVVGIGYLASSGVLQPLLDAEFERGAKEMMEANPEMTPEMMQQGRAFAEMGTKFAGFIGTPVTIFVTGCLLWLASKLVDASQSLRASVMITAWASMPKVIAAIVTAIQLRLFEVTSLDGMSRLSTGPGRFLDPDTTPPIVMAFAGRLDLFVLWKVLLMAIGLSVVARVPRAQGWIAAGAVWLLGSLTVLYSALTK